VVRARLTAQRLSGPKSSSCTDVVTRVLAVQAQDPRGARLAVRSRSTRVSASDVDDALTQRRLLVSWLNRGTLHLVTPDDYWWLHPLTTPQLVAGNQRLYDLMEGRDPETLALKPTSLLYILRHNADIDPAHDVWTDMATPTQIDYGLIANKRATPSWSIEGAITTVVSLVQSR